MINYFNMKKILNKYVVPLLNKVSVVKEEFKLSDDVFEQIKDFKYWKLTEEQELLIDKLILSEELKKCYKNYGLCNKCKQPNPDYYWCQPCVSEHFQQNFRNWTSGNHDVDEFIQKAQLKAKNKKQIIE